MDFLSYARSLNPVILSVPRTGHLNNYDSYQRTAVIQNTPKWSSNRYGYGFVPTKNAGYYIPNNTEHQITSFSLFVFFSSGLTWPGYSAQLICCAFPGTTDFQFYIAQIGGVDRIVFYDASSYSLIDTPYTGKKSAGVYVPSGAKPEFYLDGQYVGQGSLNVSCPTPSESIIIGNQGAFIGGLNTPIELACMFPGEITSENFSKLHSYFDKQSFVPRDIKTQYVPSLKNEPKVSIFGPPNANRVISDKSGYNHHATASGNLSISSDNNDTFYNFPGEGVNMGAGVITVPNNSDIEDMNPFTYVLDIDKIRSTGESGAGRLFFKNYHLRYMGSNTIRYTQIYSGGAETWDISPIPENSTGRLVFSHNRATPGTPPTAQLNGVDLNVASVTSTTGTPSSDSAHNLQLGNYNGIRQADAIFTGLNVYDKLLSTDEKRAEYLDYTLNHVIKYTNRFEHPVTFSSVSAPGNVGPPPRRH